MEGACFMVIATQIRPKKNANINGTADTHDVNGGSDIQYQVGRRTL